MTTHRGSPGEPGCLLGGYTLRYAQAVPFCATVCSFSLCTVCHTTKSLTAGTQNLFETGIHPWHSMPNSEGMSGYKSQLNVNTLICSMDLYTGVLR